MVILTFLCVYECVYIYVRKHLYYLCVCMYVYVCICMYVCRLLLERGYTIDIAYTSMLKRAIRSSWIILNEINQIYRPTIKSWRLNERMYVCMYVCMYVYMVNVYMYVHM